MPIKLGILYNGVIEEEILNRSKSENKTEDEREKMVTKSANEYAFTVVSVITGLLGLITLFTHDSIIDTRLLLTVICCGYVGRNITKYRKLDNKENLVQAIFWGILAMGLVLNMMGITFYIF